jgi:hypothetical protein
MFFSFPNYLSTFLPPEGMRNFKSMNAIPRCSGDGKIRAAWAEKLAAEPAEAAEKGVLVHSRRVFV